MTASAPSIRNTCRRNTARTRTGLPNRSGGGPRAAIFRKSLPDHQSPHTVLERQFRGGAIGLRMDWSWLALASLGYVAVFSTIVAWACVNYGTFKLGPNRASAFMYLHPVFGAILGAIFFSETLSAHHWVGIVLLLIGVVMVSKALSTEKLPAPSPAQG